MKKEVPFSVSRGDARSLVAQVADGLREAIVGGYYKPGEVVPTSRDLAPMLGVSRIVTIAALEELRQVALVEEAGFRGDVRDEGAGRL